VYDKKLKEYRAKQDEMQAKLAQLQVADENYYVTAEYVLKPASKASELFESSEPMEKRLLLKMALQNLTLKRRNVEYDWVKPFDVVSNYAPRQKWLPG